MERDGVGVESPHGVAVQPGPADEVVTGAERGRPDHDRQVELARDLHVAGVDRAQDRAPGVIANHRRDLDVGIEVIGRLEHDAGLDPAIGQDRAALGDQVGEPAHAGAISRRRRRYPGGTSAR
jgi:hypothetical protein